MNDLLLLLVIRLRSWLDKEVMTCTVFSHLECPIIKFAIVFGWEFNQLWGSGKCTDIQLKLGNICFLSLSGARLRILFSGIYHLRSKSGNSSCITVLNSVYMSMFARLPSITKVFLNPILKIMWNIEIFFPPETRITVNNHLYYTSFTYATKLSLKQYSVGLFMCLCFT